MFKSSKYNIYKQVLIEMVNNQFNYLLYNKMYNILNLYYIKTKFDFLNIYTILYISYLPRKVHISLQNNSNIQSFHIQTFFITSNIYEDRVNTNTNATTKTQTSSNIDRKAVTTFHTVVIQPDLRDVNVRNNSASGAFVLLSLPNL